MINPVILEFRNITKQFPGVLALNDVSLAVHKGEILAIMGENGAGKSTLIKIAAGLYQADAGSIVLEGKTVAIPDSQRALMLGIGMVPQELNLVPEMNLGENILLGLEPRRILGMVDTHALHQRARAILQSLNLDIDTHLTLKNLTVAQQQMAQIARALAFNCHILIMDEPTAALSYRETESLMANIRQLRENGTTILYISHRIKEVQAIADRIAVLRDGQLVIEIDRAEATEDKITQAMIGRPFKEFLQPDKKHTVTDDIVLEVRGLSYKDRVKDISFKLHRGEILGFSGLVGAGRSELMHTIFGNLKREHGDIFINQQPVEIKSPTDAIRLGVGFVPEERKQQGLFLIMNVLENISMPFVRRYQKHIMINEQAERQDASHLSNQLQVRTPSLQQPVRLLSGGNQQKVILARWLGSGVNILILDEPTRGIDVNAKAEIHNLITEMAATGKSVIIVSSEMQELITVADRIVVMREGELAGEVDPRSTSEEEILRLAMWGTNHGTESSTVSPSNQQQPMLNS